MMLPSSDLTSTSTSLSTPTSPNYNIHESPPVYFKEAIREIRSRIKLCELYSLYLDDFANIEDMYGKIIVKIGTNVRSGKDDWPVESNRVLDHLQTTTERIGKQHIGYSLCISQSISRDFFEFAKSNARRIHDIELKMQTGAEEIGKNSKIWKKKYGKYIRLVQDAEGSIVARDAAIRDYAEKINSTTEEGFFNRSITMVLGKGTTNDAMKKQHDKCRASVQELDAIEAELSELTTILHQQQEEYNLALASALRDIDAIELERLNFIKAGLLRFFQANNGMSDYLTQIFDNLKNLISALDIHVDVETFERELEVAKLTFRELSATAHGSPPQYQATERKSGEITSPSNDILAYSNTVTQDSSLPSSTTTSSSTTSSSTPPGQGQGLGTASPLGTPLYDVMNSKPDDDESLRLLRSNLMVFEKLKEGIDCLKKSAQRATSTFAEISDAEKHYSKSALKVLEKHGYSNTGNANASTMISSSFASPDPKLRELINLYESSFCHSGWNNITQVIEKLSEAHSTVAEVLLDKCCVISDNAQRKMETIVKEATDRVIQVNKKIEGAKATQMRLKSKLNRVQKELKDRRMAANTPRKSNKDDNLELGSSHHNHNHLHTGIDNAEYDKNLDGSVFSERLSMDGVDHSQMVASTSFGGSSGTSGGNTAGNIPPNHQKAKTDKGMIQGWESFGNAFGVVAVTALGAAGVLESSTERNNNRIANLEEEEAACIESLGSATASTLVVTDLCVNDLSAIIMSLKQGLSKELENLKTSLLLFIDGHTVGLNISINVLARLKYTSEAIDIQQDIIHFHSNIISASHANEERKQPNLYMLLPVEEFRRIQNDLVDLERQNEKDSYSLVLNNETNLISSPVTNENRKSLTQRRRSRTNSCGDELPLTPLSLGSSSLLPGDGQHLSRQLATDFENSTSPRTSHYESHNSDEIDDKITDISDNFLKKVNDDKISSPSLLSTRSQSDTSHSDPPHTPLIAPTECSVPDYDEETLRDLQSLSQSNTKERKIESSPPVVATATPSLSMNPENKDDSTPFMKSTSHEIGMFVGSSEEGLRRSVTTENRVGSEFPQEENHVPRPMIIPPREETWTSAELAKFDLPPSEKVLEYFSCALYPKRGLLTHGRLFITNRYLAFSGWPETRVILELQQIENVEKKQVFFLPNALSVNSNGEEYFFGSFLDRDLCYRMLTSMVMIAKSLNEITGESSSSSSTTTLNGKHRKNSLRAQLSLVDSGKEDNQQNRDLQGGDNENDDDREGHNDDGNLSSDSEDDDEFDDGTECDLSKLPDYSNLFKISSVSCVFEFSTPLATSLIWRHCWQEKAHFSNFLTSVGDFDILGTDWIPFSSTLSKSQDPLGLKFQYKRTVDYMHPRTSMLMFGPKNATAKQIQYLYLPELEQQQQQQQQHQQHSSSSSSSESHHVEISSVRKIRNGCILTATQFEGIPMSDVFEVLQYWTFQKVAVDKSMIHVGVTVNFLKGTLVKGQILSGTKEELTVLSKQWCDYSIQSIEKYLETKESKISKIEGKETRSHSTASRRKSTTKTLEETNEIMISSQITPQTVSTSVSGNTNEANGGMSRYQLVCYVSLGFALLLQILLLFLLYRQVVRLDQNLHELKNILNSTFLSSSTSSSSPSSPFSSSSSSPSLDQNETVSCNLD